MPGKRLTLEERTRIEVLFGHGLLFPEIAVLIGRDRSTVWREVNRNHAYRGSHLPQQERVRHPGRSRANRPGLGGVYRWAYSARRAQQKSQRRALRYRPGKLIGDHGRGRPINQGRLWPLVREKLNQRWSPSQIQGWLRREFPNQSEQWVSHETIYQAIYYQARGGMRAEFVHQVALRSGRTTRRPQSRLAATRKPLGGGPAHLDRPRLPSAGRVSSTRVLMRQAEASANGPVTISWPAAAHADVPPATE